MDFFFLHSYVPLTKLFTSEKGALTKTPYPFVWEFTSVHEQATDLPEMLKLLTTHAAQGHCLLKGTISKPLVKESRAGSTTTGSPTEWIVLDLDGLECPSIDQFLQQLGLHEVSYIVQWSASHGIENKLLRAHVFMMLDKPYTAPLLKQWLIQLNHEVPVLSMGMKLTKTNNSISWPLDISACQNDKLIYIAPPQLKGLRDPMGKSPRIQLVKRAKDKLSIPGTINSTEKNRELTDRRIAQLRETAGLPKRKIAYKMHGTTEVMVKPDSATITESKAERGFVYFNLNGGDSWAYYHPESNPDFIYNFKGEPAYRTAELLPDYWASLHDNINNGTNSKGITYLAFCDRATGAYWRGSYDTTNDVLDLHIAKNATQLRDFTKQVGAPLGDFIPEWDITFDPRDNVRVDRVNRTINQFTPSIYMRQVAKPVTAVPKTILKVISHALGGDPRIVEHFINWLSFILIERDRSKTAWVLHGVPGTGKGLLCNDILRPIFGATQTAMRRMEELNEPYNQFMRNSLLVFVDEVQTKALNNERGVMAKLKNFITEESVPIRQMYANAVEARNYSNWIFNSNMPDPVTIDKHDRRFNVGKYQPSRLAITDKEIAQIAKELQQFHDYLLGYPMDRDKAMSVLDTADRNTMISIGENAVDTVSNAIIAGKFGFLIEQLPTDDVHKADMRSFNRVENYRKTLLDWHHRTDPTTGACSVGREELRVVFDYTVGNMPETPNKFTSLLKHHRVHIGPVWVNAKTVNGLKITWTDLQFWQAYDNVLNPQAAPSAGKPRPSKKTKVTP
jgi:hypothetical protein